MNKLPLVGVSACLLGQRVRYDGKDKYTRLIAEELRKYCSLVTVCPEVEIGLGVPREKIQLTLVDSSIKVLKTDNTGVDLSESLAGCAVEFVNKYALTGMVLQDKSPSCGIGNTKLFSQSGKQIGVSSGLFAKTIMNLLPNLIVIRASQLQSKGDIENFVKSLL